MTRMHLLAKLALTMLGVFILIQSVSYFWLVDFRAERWGWSLMALGIFLPLFFLACRVLFWSDAWVERMISSEGQDSPALDTTAAAGGFRIVLVFCGLIIFAGEIEFLLKAAEFIVVAPKMIIGMIVGKYVDKAFYIPARHWLRLIVNLAKVVFGAYLILGAPRFIRWQMRKFYCPVSEY